MSVKYCFQWGAPRFTVQRSPAQTGPAAQIHKGNDIIVMTHRGLCSDGGMVGEESSGEENRGTEEGVCSPRTALE